MPAMEGAVPAAAPAHDRSGGGPCSLGPTYPAGLRVLLCEDDAADHGAHHHHQQQQQQKKRGCGPDAHLALLRAQEYDVTLALGARAAVEALRQQQRPAAPCSASGGASVSSDGFDVVLLDLQALAPCGGLRGPEGRALFAAAGGTPVVVMGDEGAVGSAQVLQAVRVGAADVLEKPLCPLKLKNLWQHAVRAAMAATSSGGRRQQQRQEQQHGDDGGGGDATLPPAAPAAAAQAAAGGAAAAVQGPQHSPRSEPLDTECCCVLDEVLGGLELPPLVPPELSFDPASIFHELHDSAPQHSSAPPAPQDSGRAAAPGCSRSSSMCLAAAAAGAGNAAGLSTPGGSSDQQCSGGTNFGAGGELDSSCADACSSGSSPRARRRLRACTPRRRSMQCDSSACEGTATGGYAAASLATHPQPAPPPAVGRPVVQHQHQQQHQQHQHMCPAAPAAMCGGFGSCWSPFSWGMPPPPGPKGMVWGLPMPAVVTAPGIVPQQPQAGLALGSGYVHGGAVGAAAAVAAAAMQPPLPRAAAAAAAGAPCSSLAGLTVQPWAPLPAAAAATSGAEAATPASAMAAAGLQLQQLCPSLPLQQQQCVDTCTLADDGLHPWEWCDVGADASMQLQLPLQLPRQLLSDGWA